MLIARPFKEKMVNFIETINELTILLCSYLVFTFTDFVDDASSQNLMGLVFIIVVGISIGINWIVLVYQNFMTLKEVIKKIVNKCKKRNQKNKVIDI